MAPLDLSASLDFGTAAARSATSRSRPPRPSGSSPPRTATASARCSSPERPDHAIPARDGQRPPAWPCCTGSPPRRRAEGGGADRPRAPASAGSAGRRAGAASPSCVSDFLGADDVAAARCAGSPSATRSWSSSRRPPRARAARRRRARAGRPRDRATVARSRPRDAELRERYAGGRAPSSASEHRRTVRERGRRPPRAAHRPRLAARPRPLRASRRRGPHGSRRAGAGDTGDSLIDFLAAAAAVAAGRASAVLAAVYVALQVRRRATYAVRFTNLDLLDKRRPASARAGAATSPPCVPRSPLVRSGRRRSPARHATRRCRVSGRRSSSPSTRRCRWMPTDVDAEPARGAKEAADAVPRQRARQDQRRAGVVQRRRPTILVPPTHRPRRPCATPSTASSSARAPPSARPSSPASTPSRPLPRARRRRRGTCRAPHRGDVRRRDHRGPPERDAAIAAPPRPSVPVSTIAFGTAERHDRHRQGEAVRSRCRSNRGGPRGHRRRHRRQRLRGRVRAASSKRSTPTSAARSASRSSSARSADWFVGLRASPAPADRGPEPRLVQPPALVISVLAAAVA